jgi:hypothetical protein
MPSLDLKEFPMPSALGTIQAQARKHLTIRFAVKPDFMNQLVLHCSPQVTSVRRKTYRRTEKARR